ncbi:MAG: cobalamin-dependent protein [Candidatus Bathyarchaeota archaeon]|nr:cobalamin-dependent protein [Candidatus Bathyarchaeota archaeon]MDH5532046.1 cobalamin-dependent protein [Candidatus Bathyarchaeota archaeon]MDH5713313.1 cobalamin-dependent protein [Candidatus Bathyarchaeota archaeon]
MKKEIVNKLMNSVMNCDTEGAVKTAEEALKAGVDPVEAIEEGLAKGIKIIGDRFGAGEAFLTELMIAAQAMKQAMAILEPAISKRAKTAKKALAKVMIGTVEGDIHDIGKTIVTTMLTVEGFDVIDLGVDIPVETFIKKTKQEKPDIIGMSALMTITMLKMADVIKALKKEGLRRKVKVMVGGAPTSKEWAEIIKRADKDLLP